MTGQNTLYFIPLNKSADERSGGRLVSWVNSWWKYKTRTVWGGRPLKKLAPDNWFMLYTQDMPRIWTPLPAAMETVVELFNEDRLAHTYTPHMFALPSLMTHLWRNQLSKDADVLLTVNVGPSFWTCSMH